MRNQKNKSINQIHMQNENLSPENEINEPVVAQETQETIAPIEPQQTSDEVETIEMIEESQDNNTISALDYRETLFDQLSDETKKKVIDTLDLTNLNWDVRMEDLVSITGLQTPNAGVYRNDNNTWLGTTSKKYTPYQNVELAATIIEAAHELNLDVTRGGELYDGERVYLQLELPTEKIGTTDVKRYITAMNSHNGRGSVAFGSTNNILNYNVTFYKTFNQLDKFRHHSSVQQKVKFAVQQLFKTMAHDEKMTEVFKLMANTQIEDSLLKAIMQQCYDIDLDAQESLLTERQKTKMKTVADTIGKVTQSNGNTVWSLFVAVLQTSKTSVRKNSSEMDYVMGGEGYNRNLKAYNILSAHSGNKVS